MHNVNEQHIYAIERPHSKLMTLYFIRSLLVPPLSLLGLPLMYFRYHTMRYKFDDEGISMSWGILFRHQINLTYRRIQDIHLESGPLQRWLGLADIKIQTASGSATAEMTIEGLLEYELIRDFLYSKMRGFKAPTHAIHSAPAAGALPAGDGGELVAIMREMQHELREARVALENISRRTDGNV